MTTIDNNPFRSHLPAAPQAHSPRPTYESLVDKRETLIRELVIAKHRQARGNALAFRAYQLRPRKLASNAQQGAFVAATGHFGIYALPLLPILATTFTVKHRAATSLSFHVWKQFTEHAKSKSQQKAIHAALKHHGIIHHDDTLWGTLGRNHWRTLQLHPDANGHLNSEDLGRRMDEVMWDLKLSTLWGSDDVLAELRSDIVKIVEQFASLSHDIAEVGDAWDSANIAVKKLEASTRLAMASAADLTAARAKRDELKRQIVVGDDCVSQAKLAEAIDDALERSRQYVLKGPGADQLTRENEALLAELVVAKHKEVRDNEIALRAYQLRTRNLFSNAQQAVFVGVTAHMGAYLLPFIKPAATTFTVKRYAAQSLSFHVWQHFTEFAKDKKQQHAIHNALKRHGIIHHEKTLLGLAGRNHWRTLEMRPNDDGQLDMDALGQRMDEVMGDLAMAGLWEGQELSALRTSISTILQQFASLVSDIQLYGDDWGKANREAKALWFKAQFSAPDRQRRQAVKAKRAELKHHITVGDDAVDDRKLARELSEALNLA